MDLSQIAATLPAIATQAVGLARRFGADQAEASVNYEEALAVTVRSGALDSVRRQSSRSLAVTIYRDSKKGSASTSDLVSASIEETVRRALSIGRFTTHDRHLGLAEPDLMAATPPDLGLYFPWDVDVEGGAALARRAENAARAFDSRIVQSDATTSTTSGYRAYANSHGFAGGYPKSTHALMCHVVGGADGALQRDYWSSNARSSEDLDSPERVGAEAARRAVRRLNSRPISTRIAPVIFPADISKSLFEHLAAALQGPAQYRRASFLAGAAGKQVLPSFLSVDEDPLIPRGLASAPFDGEGVATRRRELVAGGRLQGYMLSSYSARRLGLITTGNAGGAHNLVVHPNAGTLDDMISDCGSVFVVGQLLGKGVNLVTGDYSRGATGFWVEGGEVVHPVNEATIAGTLPEVFRRIAAVGSDADSRSTVRCGSLLVEALTVAGGRH